MIRRLCLRKETIVRFFYEKINKYLARSLYGEYTTQVKGLGAEPGHNFPFDNPHSSKNHSPFTALSMFFTEICGNAKVIQYITLGCCFLLIWKAWPRRSTGMGQVADSAITYPSKPSPKNSFLFELYLNTFNSRRSLSASFTSYYFVSLPIWFIFVLLQSSRCV